MGLDMTQGSNPSPGTHDLDGVSFVGNLLAGREETYNGARPEGGFGAAETGLVSSAITEPDLRGETTSNLVVPDDVSALTGQLFRFPSADLVGLAAAAFPTDVVRVDDYRFRSVGFVAGASREVRLMAEGGWPRLEVAPGLVRFARVDVNRAERQRDRLADARTKAVDEMVAKERREAHEAEYGPSPVGSGLHWAQRGYLDETDPADVPARDVIARGGITSWSPKSRANMIATVSSLDLRPVVDSGFPAMVTLTMPGDWFKLAPNAAAAARMVNNWRRAYAKMWGPLVGIWKREFQRRGAPHWHIWTVPPVHTVKCSGKPKCGCDFRRWLRYSWATAMGVPRVDDKGRKLASTHKSLGPERRTKVHCSCSEWCRSINAGTNVDRVEGLKASDPRRLAVYFLKESLGGEGKAYQNGAPREWGTWSSDVRTRVESVQFGSVGRFWGVWGIPKAVQLVPISPQDQYRLWRVLRKVRDRNGGVRPRSVPRTRLNLETGEAVVRRRKVNRRTKTTAVAGWLAVNDGAAFGVRLGQMMTDLADPRSARERSLARTPRYLERLESGARIVNGRLIRPEITVDMPDVDGSFWGTPEVKAPRRSGAAGRVWMP